MNSPPLLGSTRPSKKAKFEHDRDVTPSGSGSRGYGVKADEDVDEEEKEPEFVGDPANLEQHRKESIYLSLLSYKRQYVRTQRKVKLLEDEVHNIKTSAIVVERIWKEVVTLLESATGSKETTGHDTNIPTLLDSLKDPTLKDQLEARLKPLRQILLRLSPNTTFSSAVENYTVNVSLEAASLSLQAQKDELMEKYETVVLEMDQARRKGDKWRMELERLKAAGGTELKPNDDGSGEGVPVKREEGTQVDGQKLLREEGDKATMEDQLAGPNGNHHAETNGQILTAANDHDYLLARLKLREAEIERLSNEKAKIERDMDFLREVAWNPTEDVVTASALFKILQAEFEEQKTLADDARRLGAVAEKKAEELLANQEGFKAAIEYSYNQKFEALDRLIRSKDADIARLRGQRDAMREEADMLKGEKQVVFNSIKETDSMMAAAEDRLKAVQSELKRLRSRSAAEAAEQSYLGFLLNKTDAEVDFVKSLESKIVEAADREKALQEQIKSYMKDRDSINMTGLMRAEGRAREEAEKYKRLLNEREAAAKNGSNAALLAQIAEKSTEIDKLKGMLDEREASTMTLYSEVENLSKAYEQMERTAMKKVSDLKSTETQVLEAMTVKAKAEHKFFAECRKSNALMEQQAAITKTLEAQRVALDKSRKVEDDLRAQLAGQEKEMNTLKNQCLLASTHVQRLETDIVRYQAEAEESARRAEGRENINKERLEELKSLQSENRSLKTEMEETKHKLKQNQTMLKSTQGKGVSAGEVALQKERDMLFGILRCTACHLRFKTKILAPCLHTFCDECITARLTNRNRKCLTCMKPFAESDVKNLF